MNFIPFSFFLTHEDSFLEFNTNILETNFINILFLYGIVVYAYKSSLSQTLEIRQKTIIEMIEKAQDDVKNASNFYSLAEKSFQQSLFWLQSWKEYYQNEKIESINTKYTVIKDTLLSSFLSTETLISNFEKKSFFYLQRYLLLITVSKILRKFYFLSESEQLKLIELTILKLGGMK